MNKFKYELWGMQGQEVVILHKSSGWYAMRELYLDNLGKLSIGIKKNGKFLIFNEICEELKLDKKILQELIKIHMMNNKLFSKVRL